MLLFIISSCDNQITEPKKDFRNDTSGIFLPSQGTSALPGTENRGPIFKGKSSNSMSSTADTTTFDIIQDYLNSQNTYKFAAIAGVYNAKKNIYEYELLPLTFPDSVLQQAEGKVGTYTYQLTNPNNGVLRKLKAIIPATEASKLLLNNWLKLKDTSTSASQQALLKNGDPITSNVAEPCDEGGTEMGYCKTVWPDGHIHFYECEVANVCAESPEGGDSGGDSGGNSWPSNDGGGWGGPSGGGTGGSGSGSTGGSTGGSDGPPPCDDPIHGCVNEDPPSFENNTITNYPEVKYPEGSNYAEIYPKFTEYLKNKVPTLKDNETIINAIEKYGDLSAVDIKDQLQWGKGPTIKIVQLNLYTGCDATCLGQYNSNDPNSLLIDVDLVNDLENTTVGSHLADAFSFLVGVTVLHELVHFSEYTDQAWNSPESGELFEKDVYGQTVWRHNASIVLKSKLK